MALAELLQHNQPTCQHHRRWRMGRWSFHLDEPTQAHDPGSGPQTGSILEQRPDSSSATLSVKRWNPSILRAGERSLPELRCIIKTRQRRKTGRASLLFQPGRVDRLTHHHAAWKALILGTSIRRASSSARPHGRAVRIASPTRRCRVASGSTQCNSPLRPGDQPQLILLLAAIPPQHAQCSHSICVCVDFCECVGRRALLQGQPDRLHGHPHPVFDNKRELSTAPPVDRLAGSASTSLAPTPAGPAPGRRGGRCVCSGFAGEQTANQFLPSREAEESGRRLRGCCPEIGGKYEYNSDD